MAVNVLIMYLSEFWFYRNREQSCNSTHQVSERVVWLYHLVAEQNIDWYGGSLFYLASVDGRVEPVQALDVTTIWTKELVGGDI